MWVQGKASLGENNPQELQIRVTNIRDEESVTYHTMFC